MVPEEQPRGAEQRRPEAPDLLPSGTGKERDHAARGVETEGATNRRSRHRGRGRQAQAVGQRIPDVHGAHAMPRIERGLERQDDQHPRHVAGNLLYAVRPPRPDRGADEVRDRHAPRAQLPRQPQVEVGAVDEQRSRRTALLRGAAQRAQRAEDTRKRGQHLGDAHHRQVLRAHQRLAALRAQERPAGAEGTQPGPQRSQLA